MVVYTGFSRGRVERSLPPEHRIVAERPGDMDTEYLVEGPDLPVTPAGREPPKVKLVFTLERDKGGTVTLAVAWNHQPHTCWVIDAWPDFDAYQANLETFDGP